ncbi:MAG: DUF2141 domain-containing protein [Desulfobacterales bacterium]|nr:DUF2141 domain-containing protein [Desulfobacterales bacterium]
MNAAELIVHLEDQPPTGTIVFVLFDSANTFGDLRDPVKVVRRRLDGLSYYRIENVLPGEYALLVHYDENDNGRIDKKLHWHSEGASWFFEPIPAQGPAQL